MMITENENRFSNNVSDYDKECAGRRVIITSSRQKKITSLANTCENKS